MCGLAAAIGIVERQHRGLSECIRASQGVWVVRVSVQLDGATVVADSYQRPSHPTKFHHRGIIVGDTWNTTLRTEREGRDLFVGIATATHRAKGH